MTETTSGNKPLPRRLLVYGLGLIGASLAKAARERHLCIEVIGVSRRQSTLDKALEAGVVDRVDADSKRALGALGAGDMVVIGVPTLTIRRVLEELRDHLDPAVTITDAASVKGSVVRDAREVYGFFPPQLVPGHPIAGSEKSGVDAANAALYVDHRVILTPEPETDVAHLAAVRALWEGVGAQVSTMGFDEHDEVLAATSHIPHVLAYALVDTLARMEENREIFRYAAGGFRDFTRIAGSDPVMWHDICLANSKAILSVLDGLTASFDSLRSAIRAQDSDYILGVFTRAREARTHFAKMLEKKAYLEPMSNQPLTYRTRPALRPLSGAARVPGDKSISHRSIMLGSLANGVTHVTGFLEGEDSLATLQAFRDMGVVIEGPNQGNVTIHGVGLRGLKAPPGALYLGNSGTSMRLLAGLMAGQNFDVTMTGDDSLSRRPMKRVADPLALMGAQIETGEGGRPPLVVHGGRALKGIDYTLPMASAQVKSALLLAGLYAEGETVVTEPAPTRDHTERMLAGFGYPVERQGASARVRGGGILTACDIDVPADISSAAFFMVAASIVPGSDITLSHVGINPTRIGVVNILRQMGTDISLVNEREVGGEPVADIRVRYAPLKGIDIPEDQVPLAIDEFPVIFVAAACAEGTTVLTGAEELRVKESDRIQAMADGLNALGVHAEPTEDGIRITGGTMTSATIESHHDHRIAMAFAVAGLVATGEIQILECQNVATSFPGFVNLAGKLGFNLVELAP
ncbi:MAG: bifunctional prephenate dehydrogenase/3-phosphoshikimate 1-carboxyvinyltransferase [Porticoccaceae bacterium]|nr:bifunctional prephenate dehydrogenase/3-phosphoshikimate 1-carboxyvinyltransferase [Porticoccaceae bacterium]